MKNFDEIDEGKYKKMEDWNFQIVRCLLLKTVDINNI